MIVGHETIRAQLNALRKASMMPQTSLFYGLSGCGKKMVAMELARNLLVQDDNTRVLFEQGQHPDFFLVTPQQSKSQTARKSKTDGAIRTEQIQELKKALTYPPLLAEKQVVILDCVETMTHVTANSMLKILEEPKPHQMFILITAQLHDLLVTIRSRAAKFYFPTLSENDVATIVRAHWPATENWAEERFVFFYKCFPGSPAQISAAMRLPLQPKDVQAFWQGTDSFLSVRQKITDLLANEIDLSLFLQILKQTYLEHVLNVAHLPLAALTFFTKIQNAERQLKRYIQEEFVLETLLMD